jgi:hypothetical protein
MYCIGAGLVETICATGRFVAAFVPASWPAAVARRTKMETTDMRR